MVDLHVIEAAMDVANIKTSGMFSLYWTGLSTQCLWRTQSSAPAVTQGAVVYKNLDITVPTLSGYKAYSQSRFTFKFKGYVNTVSVSRSDTVCYRVVLNWGSSDDKAIKQVGFSIVKYTGDGTFYMYTYETYNSDGSEFLVYNNAGVINTNPLGYAGGSVLNFDIEFNVAIYKNAAGEPRMIVDGIIDFNTGGTSTRATKIWRSNISAAHLARLSLCDKFQAYNAADVANLETFIQECVL